jgi:hypothetical protein
LIEGRGEHTGFWSKRHAGADRIEVDVQRTEQDREIIQQHFDVISGFPESASLPIDQIEVSGGVEFQGFHKATDAREIGPHFANSLFVFGEFLDVFRGGLGHSFSFGICVRLTVSGEDEEGSSRHFEIAHLLDQVGPIAELNVHVIIHQSEPKDVDGIGGGERFESFQDDIASGLCGFASGFSVPQEEVLTDTAIGDVKGGRKGWIGDNGSVFSHAAAPWE